MKVPFIPAIYNRGVAKTPSVLVQNRFFEQNPILNVDSATLITRPSMKKFAEVGTGHGRKFYSEPGTFDDDGFFVSGLFLYRIDAETGADTLLGQISTDPRGAVEMAAAANLGEGATPERLFICEGEVLWVYMANGSARSVLQNTGVFVNDNDVVEIGGIYYKFTTGSVDAGTPTGTAGSPYLVARTGVNTTDFENLYNAINDYGESGVDYSSAVAPHPTVTAYAKSATDLYISAIDYGIAGNNITTSTTGVDLEWTDTTLGEGGTDMLRQVPVPQGLGAISVAHINGYIIVVPVQTGNYNGRFYWIEPGEVVIDPLNFATAERAPDAVNQVLVYSDMFWLCGQSTTQPWITTGDPDFPMVPFKGVLYDRGCWEGTAVKVKESLILCDPDGAVFQIQGGLKRVSRPDIEERIRKAIQLEGAYIS